MNRHILSYDLHFIPEDKVDIALNLLIKADIITSSTKCLCKSAADALKRTFPDKGCCIEIFY